MSTKHASRCVAVLAALCLATAVPYALGSSAQFYLKIKGSKQGDFKADKAPGTQFTLQATPQEASSGIPTGKQSSPRDASSGMASGKVTATRDSASGMASGKRQHGQIKIVKEWGAASPQLMQASSTNELLTSVVMEFVHPGEGGGEEVYKTLTLTDAIISSYQKLPGDTKPMEEITFVFQKIEMRDKAGKTMAMDDWTATK